MKHGCFFVDNGAVSKRDTCLDRIHPLECTKTTIAKDFRWNFIKLLYFQMPKSPRFEKRKFFKKILFCQA